MGAPALINDQDAMALALNAAQAAAADGEVPVGAVVVSGEGHMLASAGNATIRAHDPAGHAEIRALRAAALVVGNYRLPGASLYVTLEPCAMCAGVISHARISRLVIAAADPKGGAVWHGPEFFDQSTCHWRPEVIEGPLAEEAGALLRDFFRARRK